MLTIEALREYGANVDEGLARCVNNTALYLRLVKMAVDEKHYTGLKDAVAKGDRKAAFEAAHALKGTLGNLALTPLFDPVSEMTELLRADKEADYDAYLARILRGRDDLLALCEE